MATFRDALSLLTRLVGVVALWGPALLWLMVLRPGTATRPEWSHLLAATALATIGAHALHHLTRIPVAPDRPGRHRVVPRAPDRPYLLASVGLGAMLWGAQAAWSHGVDLVALAAVPSGLLAAWLAAGMRRDPLWGTWLEISGDAVRVHCPAADDWSVPLARVVAVHRRPADGSFVIEAPRPEHDVFVPSVGSGARYHVTHADRLLATLVERVPVVDTPLLLAARLRADRSAD